MKILNVFGTRPEAIKMAPVIKALKHKFKHVKICITSQHRSMLQQVLDLFQLSVDYDLDIMKPNQSLSDITQSVLAGLDKLLVADKPDLILVQGDTTTTFAAGLAAFYHKISLGHIEAGLRSFDKYAPWPEEINRKLTSCLADFHFVPTLVSAENLLKENIPKDKIFITGNTVVDALFEVKNILENDRKLNTELEKNFSYLNINKKLILVTGHRRESFGKGFEEICKALKDLASHPEVEIIYPVHLNPNVQKPVKEYLNQLKNVFLVEPQDYLSLVYLMQRSYLVLTDSGGIQEEAPSFGKPVLVMRETTERPEGVMAGTSKLVGAHSARIVEAATQLLKDKTAYQQMSMQHNPYGDGLAASRIVDIIAQTRGRIDIHCFQLQNE